MVGFTTWRVKVCAPHSREFIPVHLPQRVMTNQIGPNDDGTSDGSQPSTSHEGLLVLNAKS